MNLPWSGSESSDDVWWHDTKRFEGREVVITEKIDGECTTIYPDGHVHARSIDTDRHPSRSWVKQLAGTIAHDIPEGWRICGENVYAYHSVFYTNLPSYFLVFGIYDDQNNCVSWDDMWQLCELLGLYTVPVLYRGQWNEKFVRDELWDGVGTYPTYETTDLHPKFPDTFSPCVAEGYVVRDAGMFHHGDFAEFCAKYVRPAHVKTSAHWLSRPVVPNLLKSS